MLMRVEWNPCNNPSVLLKEQLQFDYILEINLNSQDRFYSEFRVENKITLLSHLFLFRLYGFVRVISDEIAMACKEKFPFRITITIPSVGRIEEIEEVEE